ncbi:MAG: DUF2973 domain-containing protein [Cyanobacteria bacterium J06598_1]
MLHLIYVIAFTVLAVIAVSNMIRNVVQLGTQVQQPPRQSTRPSADRPVPHPELLNDSGDVIDEPLLVMRSISIKDAREKLNALYESSAEDSSAEDS